MKTYVITLAKVFPAGHPRAGEPTHFRHKVEAAINGWSDHWLKLHTIRGNYPLWKKRFEQIDAGKACLSVREWSGKPYHSKQVEIARLTKEDGIGLQKLKSCKTVWQSIISALNDETVYEPYNLSIAYNDGLTFNDWFCWFKDQDLSNLAIIHFTGFRYHN